MENNQIELEKEHLNNVLFEIDKQIEKNAITRMQLPSRAKKLKPYVA